MSGEKFQAFLFRLSRGTFPPEYVQMRTEREYLEAALNRLREKKQAVEQELARKRSVQISGEMYAEELNYLNEAYEQTEQRYKELSKEIKELEKVLEEQAREKRVPSITQMLLYGGAGIAFMLGELIVSKEIVAQVLYLPEEYERWMFAIGVAFIPFVFKLAYERLVEQPYWDEERSGRFTITIVLVLALILSGIILIGFLRGNAILDQKRLENMDVKGWSLDAVSPSVEDVASRLSTSPGIMKSSFIVIALIFAVSSGICLAVAARYGHTYWHTYYRLKRRLSKLQKVHNQKEKILVDLNRRRQEVARKLKGVQAEQALTRSIPDIEKELEELEDKIETREREYYEKLEQERSMYASMLKQRKKASKISEDTRMEVPPQETGTDNVQASTQRLETPRQHTRREPGVRHGRRRPYLDIRDAILTLTS